MTSRTIADYITQQILLNRAKCVNPSRIEIELSEKEIKAPKIFESPYELFIHIERFGEKIEGSHREGCLLAFWHAHQDKPFYVRYCWWPDNNWSCIYNDSYRGRWSVPIFVGNFESGYFASRNHERHFYYLERSPSNNFILPT